MRDATTGPWWQRNNTSPCAVNARVLEKAKVAGIETLVVNHPLIDLIVKLRYRNEAIHAHYKTPWPPHCYMPMVVPEILAKRGYDYTVAIDYDASFLNPSPSSPRFAARYRSSPRTARSSPSCPRSRASA